MAIALAINIVHFVYTVLGIRATMKMAKILKEGRGGCDDIDILKKELNLYNLKNFKHCFKNICILECLFLKPLLNHNKIKQVRKSHFVQKYSASIFLPFIKYLHDSSTAFYFCGPYMDIRLHNTIHWRCRVGLPLHYIEFSSRTCHLFFFLSCVVVA